MAFSRAVERRKDWASAPMGFGIPQRLKPFLFRAFLLDVDPAHWRPAVAFVPSDHSTLEPVNYCMGHGLPQQRLAVQGGTGSLRTGLCASTT